MDKKEFLNQVRNLDRKIKNNKTKVQNLRLMAEAVRTPKIDGNKVSASTNGSAPFENLIIKAIDLEKEIEEEERKLDETKKIVTDVILRLDDGIEQAVLFHRYILFEDWDCVANSIGYSTNYTFESHRRAIKKLEI